VGNYSGCKHTNRNDLPIGIGRPGQNASEVTVTVGTSLGFSAGQSIDLLSLGDGQVVVAAGGATVVGAPGLKLRTKYSAATLFCIGTNSFVLIGDLSA
jgi:hypothetical protein